MAIYASFNPKKTRRAKSQAGLKGCEKMGRNSSYFCQVRFLWRLAFKRFLRLCLFIWRRRFFLRLPMWSQD
jgi:hypothetical protein